jgi:hypothetical protein
MLGIFSQAMHKIKIMIMSRGRHFSRSKKGFKKSYIKKNDNNGGSKKRDDRKKQLIQICCFSAFPSLHVFLQVDYDMV